MSKYSFLKSGHSNLVEPLKISNKEKEDIESILNVFIVNAIKNAAIYVEFSNRNGITKDDMCYGLRYEVFEFLKRPNILEEIEQMKKEISNDNGDSDNGDSDNGDSDNGNDNGNENDFIVPDNILNKFERIELKYINETNKEFITKYHEYYDKWEEWKPQTPIEHILKNAINKIN